MPRCRSAPQMQSRFPGPAHLQDPNTQFPRGSPDKKWARQRWLKRCCSGLRRAKKQAARYREARVKATRGNGKEFGKFEWNLPRGSVNRQLDMLEQFVELGLGVALVRLFNQLALEMRSKHLDEVVHEAAQERAATKADLGHARCKQMARIEC